MCVRVSVCGCVRASARVREEFINHKEFNIY